MLGLNASKYANVFLKKRPVSPWIVNPDAIEKFKESANYLGARAQSHRSSKKVETWDQIIKSIGLVSHLPSAKPFLKRSEYDSFLKRTEAICTTERCMVPSYFGGGSSRHFLTPSLQFKGAGLNSLCRLQDYEHNWGGYTLRDGLRSLISDAFIEKRSRLGAAKTQGIFLYKRHELLPLPLVLVARECDSFRLSQVIGTQLSRSESETLKQSLRQRFQSESREFIFKTVMQNYIQSYHAGIFPRSVTLENLLLDGRFIDSESIDFTENANVPAPLFVELLIETKEDLTQSNLTKEFLIRNHGNFTIRIQSSWLHLLRFICLSTAEAYDLIWGEQNKSEIWNQARDEVFGLFKGQFLKTEFLMKYLDWRELAEGQLSQEIHERDKEQFLNLLSTLNLNEVKFDAKLKKSKWLFSSSLRDPRFRCLDIQKKIELLMLPYAGLRIEDAHQNWNELKALVDKVEGLEK